MDKYIYWLDNVPYLGDRAKVQLLETFHSAEEVYRAKESHLKCILDEKKADALQQSKLVWDVTGEYDALKKKNIHFVTVNEEAFPRNLKNIPDPPFGLYYKGHLPEERLPGVAVIGARQCSEYGRFVAQELGRCLGENHIQVISGMASGIDGISQLAALEAGGASFGVLGCGVDVCYPRSNFRLYESLVEKGGVISSYPLGTQPLRQLFPPRNRIVSGLADVLVVIEARQKSGTSITVEMALEQGKDIFAVPGRVTDRLSDGCNRMLKEGAHVFLSPQDFVLELHQLLPEKMAYAKQFQKEAPAGLEGISQPAGDAEGDFVTEEWQKVLSVLDLYPQYIDRIAERLLAEQGINMTISRLSTLLVQMCLLDEVKQETPGWFLKSGSYNDK